MAVEAHPDLPPAAFLDRGKISRVLVNLLANAVKYTASGRVVAAARPWQGSVTFEVRDTGAGIPADLIAKAFEPFQQIRPRSGEAPRGTGLGLSISKQLVEVMGGDLILQSREGVGTTVTFTVPELPHAGPDPGAETPAPARPTGGVKLACRWPRASWWSKTTRPHDTGSPRSSSRRATRRKPPAASRRPTRFLRSSSIDAVILDVTLPDGDGATWLARRKERQLDTPPVLALTGVTADEDIRRIRASGVRQVLTKPVNVTQLLLVLKETLIANKPS